MADRIEVPYPRWPETSPLEVTDALSRAGVEMDLAQSIGQALGDIFIRMANENEVNGVTSVDQVTGVATNVEVHPHDGVDDTQVNHTSLLGVTTDNHHNQDHAARHTDGGADEVTVTEAQISDLVHYDTADFAVDQAASDAAVHGSGASTDGQVLTSDGAGAAAWEDASGGAGGTYEVLLDESQQPVATGTGDWLYVEVSY